MPLSEDIKNIKKNLSFKTVEDEKRDPINALPEYKIRTMKDDLAELGLEKLEKEAKIPQPSEKIEVIPEPLIEKKEEVISPRPARYEPKRAPLPSAEELVTEKIAPANLPIEKEEVVPPAKKPAYRKPAYQPDFIKAIRSKKRLKFLVILIIIFLILLGIGSFFYWQGKKQPPPKPPTGGQQPEKPKPSESLIVAEEVKTPSLIDEASLLDLLKEEAGADQSAGTFKRIAILKNEKDFLSLNEVLQKLEIVPPPYVLTELKENYNLVLYSQNGKRHLELIIEVKNPNNLKEQLRFWEETMVNDLRNIFLTATPGKPATPKFQDNIYKETAIRYINFPEPDLTIDYAIVNNLFALTTSKESMYRIIDRIKK